MNLNFEHKTPANFYSNDQGFGLADCKVEGEIWLEQLPADSILVRPEVYFLALRSGYSNFGLGLKEGLMYHVLIPKNEVENDSND